MSTVCVVGGSGDPVSVAIVPLSPAQAPADVPGVRLGEEVPCLIFDELLAERGGPSLLAADPEWMVVPERLGGERLDQMIDRLSEPMTRDTIQYLSWMAAWESYLTRLPEPESYPEPEPDEEPQRPETDLAGCSW